MRTAVSLLVLLTFAAPVCPKDDPHAPARKARDAVCELLSGLADEARAKGDVMAAQAIGETYLWVAGVPHAHLDALRVELVEGFAKGNNQDEWVSASWKKVLPHAAVLAKSKRDWDVLDAQLLEQLPAVLPLMRYLNKARISAGLRPMRYDAKRSIPSIRDARYYVRSDREAWELVRIEEAAPWFIHGSGTSMELFAPADKGITIGTWREGEREHCDIRPSGNLDPRAAHPKRIVFPPENARDVPRVTLRKGKKEILGPVMTFMTLQASDLEGLLEATWRSGSNALDPQVTEYDKWYGPEGGYTTLTVSLHHALKPNTRYVVELRKRDGPLLHRWTFTTGK